MGDNGEKGRNGRFPTIIEVNEISYSHFEELIETSFLSIPVYSCPFLSSLVHSYSILYVLVHSNTCQPFVSMSAVCLHVSCLFTYQLFVYISTVCLHVSSYSCLSLSKM